MLSPPENWRIHVFPFCYGISRIQAAQVEENQQQTHFSPTQKRFNQLIHEINTQKMLLASWQETIRQYQLEIATKLTPLCDKFCEHQAEMAVRPIA